MNHSPTFNFYTPNPISSHDGKKVETYDDMTHYKFMLSKFHLLDSSFNGYCRLFSLKPPAPLSLSKNDLSLSWKKKMKAEWGFLFVIFSSVGPGKTCSFSFLHKCFPFSACIQQNKISFLFLPPPVALVFFFFFLLSFFFL